MNLFSPILRLFGMGGLNNNETGHQSTGPGTSTTDAGIIVTDERALQVSSVWACVQYITNSVGSLPLKFYTKTEDGREELDDRHYLNMLFNGRPNAFMKPRDFRKAMTMQLCNWQNAYAEITRRSDGTPISLMPLRPGKMSTFITNDNELQYHYHTDKGIVIFAQKSILHLKGFGSDGIVGFDRSDFARKTLGLSVSADVYASKQFANDGTSGGGFLIFDDWLTEEQREQARAIYGKVTETAYQKGSLTVLEGGVKYENPGLNPDDMQMIETRKMQIGEIARFYGVPEVLIGSGGATSSWPASFEQQLLSFLTFTLQDYIDEWESAIKYSLLTTSDRGKVFADHDTTGFIKMDSQARAQLQSTWVQNGLKTRNEIRKINNDPPIVGADELTVQVNLTPVQDLEKVNDTETRQSDSGM